MTFYKFRVHQKEKERKEIINVKLNVLESETKNKKETSREISLGVWIALLLLLDEHHRVIEQTLKETVEPQIRFFLD